MQDACSFGTHVLSSGRVGKPSGFLYYLKAFSNLGSPEVPFCPLYLGGLLIQAEYSGFRHRFQLSVKGRGKSRLCQVCFSKSLVL